MKVSLGASVLVLGLGVIVAGGCDKGPTDAQLDEWRKEAVARNQALIAERTQKRPGLTLDLEVDGPSLAAPAKLSWAELDKLATTHVKTRAPHHTSDLQAVLDFRGVPLAQLLDRYPPPAGVDEITFVASDAYVTTVKVADVRRWPIVLALEMNGQPIPRSEGGPLLLVFPYTDHPEAEKRYTEDAWSFYVTHVFFGDPPARLRVGDKTFDAAALAKLPQSEIYVPVGFRMRWPSEPVHLRGVRLRDLVAATGAPLVDGGFVVVRGRPPVYRDNGRPFRLAAADVKSCDILLAMSWGDDRAPIPAPMGGPIALAFPSACRAKYRDQPWITYVDELRVLRP